jgi:hypothetical protein
LDLDRPWARAHSEGETNRPKSPLLAQAEQRRFLFRGSSRIERERSSRDQRAVSGAEQRRRRRPAGGRGAEAERRKRKRKRARMPCLNVSTNVNLEGVDTSAILAEASESVASIIGKPEAVSLRLPLPPDFSLPLFSPSISCCLCRLL